MKKLYIIATLLTNLSIQITAQTNFQGALKPTPTVPSGVSIFLKSTSAYSGKVSGLLVCLAIPTSIGAKPTAVANNVPNNSITYDYIPQVNQSIQGVQHYIYSFIGTGDVTATGQTYASAANVEKEIVRIVFSGVGSSQVKWVNLPDGGAGDGAGGFIQGYFGFSLDGVDRVNETAMFYSVPSVSTASNEIIPGGYSGLSLTNTNASIVLPVKFTSFSATKKANDGILTWAVQNENTNTLKYEIERSLDGITFEKINTINPYNNSSSSNVYTILDENIVNVKNNGIFYYRIKQIDVDGKLVYSEIKSIRVNDVAILSAFPNPTKTFTTIKIEATATETININIINSDGKQVQNVGMQVQKGVNLKAIDLSTLAAGNYLIKAIIGNQQKTIPIIKL